MMNSNPDIGYWCASLTVPHTALEAAEDVLTAVEGEVPSIAAFAEAAGSRTYHVNAFYTAPPDQALLEASLRAALGDDLMAFDLAAMPPRDWVAETQAMLPAITAGRFYVHGAHARNGLKPGQTGLLIEAAQAFGTGRHETTYGCLLALDWLAKRRAIRPRRALDLGCGSAVLALAIHKMWRGAVIASDLDPVSVKVAAGNVRDNRVHQRHSAHRAGISLRVATGFADRLVAAGRPYPLIVANILSDPLIGLSYAMVRAAAANGVIILSGLLVSQQAGVLAAYRRQGWHLKKKIRIGDWPTLILRSGGGRK